MTFNSNNSFKMDYYQNMPDDEFKIFLERLKTLHCTGKYIPPPPKITVCKDIKTSKRKKVTKCESEPEKRKLNTSFGKGQVGRGHGSCKVKYCTCCNKRRSELEQYTTSVFGTDLKETIYPISDITNLYCDSESSQTKENTMNFEANVYKCGLNAVENNNNKPSSSNVENCNTVSTDNVKIEVESNPVQSNFDDDIIITSIRSISNDIDEKSEIIRKLMSNITEEFVSSSEPDSVDNSVIILDDTQPVVLDDSVIDLVSSTYAVPNALDIISILDETIASSENSSISSQDVEIVDIYKPRNNERKELVSQSSLIKTRSRTVAGSPRTKRLQTSKLNVPVVKSKKSVAVNKKQTESNVSAKENITNIDNGAKERYIGDCPVCLDNLKNKEIMSTICGHLFCSTCIQNVIRLTKCCPSCRKRLTLKSIHPIYI